MLLRSMLLAGLVSLVAVPTMASTITHYSSAMSFGAPAATSEQNLSNGEAASATLNYSAPFVWGGSSTFQNAQFVGQASATLNDGSLRTYSSVTNHAPISGPILALGARSHMNYSEAGFGDTFTIGLSDPHVAVSGAMATLKFTISGTFTSTGAIDLNSTYDQFGQATAYNSFEFSSGLAVHQVGAFDIQNQARSLNMDDFADFSEYYAAFLALNAQYEDTLIARTAVSQHSNQTVVNAAVLPPGYQLTLAEDGTVLVVLELQLSLDDIETSFEWHADLFTRVILDSSTINASLTADFGHTAVLEVVLPEGYTLTSSSNAFPDANVVTATPSTSVPEAPALALFAMGLAGLVLSRMRRKA